VRFSRVASTVAAKCLAHARRQPIGLAQSYDPDIALHQAFGLGDEIAMKQLHQEADSVLGRCQFSLENANKVR